MNASWRTTTRSALVLAMVCGATACRNQRRPPAEESATIGNSTTPADTSGSDSDGSTSDMSSSTSTTGETAPDESESSSTGGPTGCSLGSPCEAGLFCVAPYADNHRGAFVCETECITDHDEASWCFDASACCTIDAVCTSRGYCEAPTGDGSSSGGATDDSTG